MLKGGRGSLPLLDLDVEPVRIVRRYGKRAELVTVDHFGDDGHRQWAEAELALQWADTEPAPPTEESPTDRRKF